MSIKPRRLSRFLIVAGLLSTALGIAFLWMPTAGGSVIGQVPGVLPAGGRPESPQPTAGTVDRVPLAAEPRNSSGVVLALQPATLVPNRLQVHLPGRVVTPANLGGNRWDLHISTMEALDSHVVAEYGPSTTVEIRQISGPTPQVVVPPLETAEVAVQGGDASDTWGMSAVPLAEERLVPSITFPLVASSATALLACAMHEEKELPTSNVVRLVGPASLCWRVAFFVKKRRVEPATGRATCPGRLEARILDPLPAIHVHTDCPAGSSVVLFGQIGEAGGPWLPLGQEQIGDGDVVFTRLVGRSGPLPPNYSFQVTCFTSTRELGQVLGVTDSNGEAHVTLTRDMLVAPWSMAIPKGSSVACMHLRHGNQWVTLWDTKGSNISDRWGDILFLDSSKGYLELSTMEKEWGTAYIVLDSGAVGSVTEGRDKELRPYWPKTAATTISTGLFCEDGVFNWSLEFLDHESHSYLYLAGGRSTIAELNQQITLQNLGLQTRLRLNKPGGSKPTVFVETPYH